MFDPFKSKKCTKEVISATQYHRLDILCNAAYQKYTLIELSVIVPSKPLEI